MSESPLEARVADGVVQARLVLPDAPSGPLPLAVFYMDAGGMRPAMSAMAQRLADAGYAVLLPDLYWRNGPYAPFDARTLFTDPDQRVRVRAMMDALTKDQVVGDTRALLDALAADPRLRPGATDRVGVVGYCMGGRMAFVAASRLADRVAAAASIHGGGLVTAEPDSPHLGAPRIRGRLYFGVADEDASCSPEHQAGLRAALDAAGVRYQLELNPGARHGYAVPDFPVYDAAAAERHWERVLALFGAEVRG